MDPNPVETTKPGPEPTAEKYAGAELRGPKNPAKGIRTAEGFEVDRIYGMFFGAVLGGAVALVCNNRNADVLAGNYPKGLEYPRLASQGAEIQGYPPNDWTGDLDQMFVVIRALRVADTTAPTPATSFRKHLARYLLEWSSRGFSELGDREGHGADSTTIRVAGHPVFLADPQRAARETLGIRAGGTSTVRVVAAAILATPFATEDAAVAATEVTHADPSCVAAAVHHALQLRALLLGSPPTPEGARFPAHRAASHFGNPSQRSEFLRRLRASGELTVEGWDAGTASRCGVWAYRQLLKTPRAQWGPGFFKDCIQKIALKGGDASANAAAAGAILGAALGASQLPEAWLTGLPNREWISAEIVALLEPPTGEQQASDTQERRQV